MEIRWGEGQPKENLGQKCARYDPNEDEIVSFWCSNFLCPICEVRLPVKFQMNGPNFDNIDKHYVMTDADTFHGYMYSNIVNENDIFKIEDALTRKNHGCIRDSKVKSPIGTNYWHRKCPPERQTSNYFVFNLHQYVKLPGEFACGDGDIIESKHVCDSKYDCHDSSDEHNCDARIRIRPDFNNQVGEEEMIVNVSISILEFLDLK